MKGKIYKGFSKLTEAEKRKNFVKSRHENLKKVKEKPSHMDAHMKHHMEPHMENENENRKFFRPKST